jgi:hypothetical protein
MGKIDDKTTHFRNFWEILPIAVRKRITDSNRLENMHHENG